MGACELCIACGVTHAQEALGLAHYLVEFQRLSTDSSIIVRMCAPRDLKSPKLKKNGPPTTTAVPKPGLGFVTEDQVGAVAC